jgi:hypothetical protein
MDLSGLIKLKHLRHLTGDSYLTNKSYRIPTSPLVNKILLHLGGSSFKWLKLFSGPFDDVGTMTRLDVKTPVF